MNPWITATAAALWSVGASASDSLSPTAPPADIPFAVEDGDIVVQVELTPGRPLPFVFDSGLSEGHIIAPDVASSLKLAPTGKIHFRNAAGVSGDADVVRLPPMRAGQAVLAGQSAAVAPMPPALAERGKGQAPIVGFLGAPLMKDSVLCIDYGHGAMQRWKRTDFDEGTLSVVAMPLNHGLPTVVVNLDGRRTTLVVDTGNNAAVALYPSFGPHGAEAGTLEFADGTGFHHVPLSPAGQGSDPAWGIDGMIGSALLSQLDPCLDRDGQKILWEP